MEVKSSKLDGVLVIEPPSIFEDFRGTYVETYNEALYKKAGIAVDFVEDDISVNSEGVLRGVHGDSETWKLITCFYGEFYLVVLNYDQDSPQFGQWESFILSDQNRLQVLVPPKFGNGHLVISDHSIFFYKQSAYYERDRQFTVLWNDPRFNIQWPITNPILSKRDSGLE